MQSSFTGDPSDRKPINSDPVPESRAQRLDSLTNHEAHTITSRCDEQAENHIKMERGLDIADPVGKKADERREILRRFMQERGLVAAQWAKQSGVAVNSIYNFLNGQSDRLSHITYAKLARVARVPAWRISGEEPEPPSPTTVYVVGFVEAGVWQEAVEWDRSDWRAIDVPVASRFRGKSKALEVRGRSMELIYPPSSIVIWVSITDFRAPRSGDKVIVYREHYDGRIEATVKEYREEEGQVWLWPRSADPAHQAPISLRQPGESVRDIHVVGIVVGSYRPEEDV